MAVKIAGQTLVTRGFGEGSTASSIVLRGFSYLTGLVKKIRRKGRTAAEEIIEYARDTYKITVMLLSINDEEIVHPKSSTITREVEDNDVTVTISDLILSRLKRPLRRIIISGLDVFRRRK